LKVENSLIFFQLFLINVAEPFGLMA